MWSLPHHSVLDCCWMIPTGGRGDCVIFYLDLRSEVKVRVLYQYSEDAAAVGNFQDLNEGWWVFILVWRSEALFCRVSRGTTCSSGTRMMNVLELFSFVFQQWDFGPVKLFKASFDVFKLDFTCIVSLYVRHGQITLLPLWRPHCRSHQVFCLKLSLFFLLNWVDSLYHLIFACKCCLSDILKCWWSNESFINYAYTDTWFIRHYNITHKKSSLQYVINCLCTWTRHTQVTSNC